MEGAYPGPALRRSVGSPAFGAKRKISPAHPRRVCRAQRRARKPRFCGAEMCRTTRGAAQPHSLVPPESPFPQERPCPSKLLIKEDGRPSRLTVPVRRNRRRSQTVAHNGSNYLSRNGLYSTKAVLPFPRILAEPPTPRASVVRTGHTFLLPPVHPVPRESDNCYGVARRPPKPR